MFSLHDIANEIYRELIYCGIEKSLGTLFWEESIMRRKLGLLLLLASIGSGGCAGILNPGPDKVVFKSEPAGATVNLDGKDVGQTPCTVKVARSAFLVKMRLAGYKDGTAPILYKTNGAIWADLIFFPILFGDGFVFAVDIDTLARNDRVAVGQVDVKLENAN